MKLEKITSRQLLTGGTIAALSGLLLFIISLIYFGDLNRLNHLAKGICEPGHESLDTCAMLLAADATKQSVYLTAFVLAANAVTIIGVYLTLRETRNATAEAKRAADIANYTLNADRAFIEMTYPHITDKADLIGRPDLHMCMVEIRGKNIGTRTAMDTTIRSRITFCDKDGRPTGTQKIQIKFPGKTVPAGDTYASVPVHFLRNDIYELAKAEGHLRAEFALSYRDALYKDRHTYEIKIYQISFWVGPSEKDLFPMPDLISTNIFDDTPHYDPFANPSA